jgi:predicted negative regulator of RcsB-dependent stress response
VALNAAEEETVEALKKWWDENGKQLLLMVVVVAAGYSGWLFWQNSTQASSNAASDLYEQILTLSERDEVTVSAEDGTQILELAEVLRAEHSDSVYALFASLFDAQQSVRVNDLESAESSLQWILDNQQSGIFSQTEEGLILTASLRLGRVILARGDAERALTLVNNINPMTFEPGFAELRGDIYLAMGRIVDAREAYVAAQQAGSSSNGLRMKLENLTNEG